ncbi:hypothetical protein ILUMI_23429 [Ignelater luminosus]|uniref:Endonuclease/exonuclease/phosphatase domain-containing protein n=1 Tax=Ignelater luminosus TaxID=2038154 RepID=A0A8K0FWY1_IGNLU|nr:hypothetical protein ILUMI_23429 [Ignelater luminosus]
MYTLRLKGNFFSFNRRETKEQFHEELETSYQACPKIILGDLNAKVGRKTQYQAQSPQGIKRQRGYSNDRERKALILEEVTSAIKKKLKIIKSITAELIKEGGKRLTSKMHQVLAEVWVTKQLPQEWNLGIIVPPHKKGDQLLCENL